jgi:non-heme chloroperoxidase
MAYFETDSGGRVYFEHHRAPGMPVVLIHGWGMSGDYWASAVEALLAEGHSAIVIDPVMLLRSSNAANHNALY